MLKTACRFSNLFSRNRVVSDVGNLVRIIWQNHRIAEPSKGRLEFQMRQMCLKVGKIVSSKPGNWVRCRPAKLVISSHFRASHLIIHTEKLFSYHEMSSGQETVERVTSASILRCVSNYKEMAWRPNTNTSSISSV